MKRIVTIIACMIAIAAHAQTVKVAAAGNLRYILDEIKAEYVKQHPRIKIEVSLGASGALTQQIMNGAGFDFFMSADKIYPDKLKDQGLASGDVKTYAFGKLALWSNTIDVSKGVDVITGDNVKHIAIAKPEIAPYGARAIESLKALGLYEKVKDKLVYADNIAQAAQFAQSGNAEVAFIALALVYGPELKGQYILVDPASYKPVEQACVLIKGWERNPEAKKFMQFVLGTECKAIFGKYGFVVP